MSKEVTDGAKVFLGSLAGPIIITDTSNLRPLRVIPDRQPMTHIAPYIFFNDTRLRIREEDSTLSSAMQTDFKPKEIDGLPGMRLVESFKDDNGRGEIDVSFDLCTNSTTTRMIYLAFRVRDTGIKDIKNNLVVALTQEGCEKIAEILGTADTDPVQNRGGSYYFRWNIIDNKYDVLYDIGDSRDKLMSSLSIDELKQLGFTDIPDVVDLGQYSDNFSLNLGDKRVEFNMSLEEAGDLKQNILKGKPMVPVTIKVDSETIF